jgi:hypothetical protein
MSPKDMTDEQFEQYLVSKYGADWFNAELTPEEIDRFPKINDKEVVAAIKEAVGKNIEIEEVK